MLVRRMLALWSAVIDDLRRASGGMLNIIFYTWATEHDWVGPPRITKNAGVRPLHRRRRI